MSIIIDNDTKLVVSGLTGREGSFHGLRNRDYGTQLVAGVTPGKGGQDVEGTPIFNTIRESVDEAGANTSMTPPTSRTSNFGNGFGAIGNWWVRT